MRVNELDFKTKKKIAGFFGVIINSEDKEIEVMRDVSFRFLIRHGIVLPNDKDSHHKTVYSNHTYCTCSRMLLLNGTECVGCYKRKDWETLTANILKWFDKDSYPWFYIPQFQHIELVSGKGRNHYMPFDFVGIDSNPFKIIHRRTLPDWCLEVNENGHFNSNIFQMKPSDYLKWDFCLRNRIPLLYLNLLDFPDEDLRKIKSALEIIMNRIREYVDLKRTVTDQKEIDSYFIEHFCELPYKKIELHTDFDQTPDLKEICFNLTSYSETRLKAYVKRTYFK